MYKDMNSTWIEHQDLGELCQLSAGLLHNGKSLGFCLQAGFSGGSDDKESTSNAGDPGLTMNQEDPLEKGMVIHLSILVWRIPWTEEPGGLTLSLSFCFIGIVCLCLSDICLYVLLYQYHTILIAISL